MKRLCIPLLCSSILFNDLQLGYAEVPTGGSDLSKPAGHSLHGAAFNEGPRQAAYLMPGMPNVDFKPTTTSPLAAKFVNQGVGQLHGFWYLEAERSFRQAAAIDPQCAIAFWGMAMANKQNEVRAKGFLNQAMAVKDKASPREQKYVAAFAKYYGLDRAEGESDGRSRADKARDLTRDLEQISLDFPEDIEAKALICYRMWENEHEELPITSRLTVDALLEDIFRANPMHPAHHYRIHLWDGTRATRAIDSAAKCGPSSPGIAHMWHMPGHTYSELKRYHDAVYQQEASARVDHAHMMRDRVMPDEIHNFAHNNEWLIRNLLAIGRIDDALDLAKNMISLPRHPKYNSKQSHGSNSYGRDRLCEALVRYRLWPEIIALKNHVLFDAKPDEDFFIDKLQLLAMAGFAADNPAVAVQAMEILEPKLVTCESKIAQLEEEPPAPPERQTEDPFQKSKIESFRKWKEERQKELETERSLQKRLKRAIAAANAQKAMRESRWEDCLAELDRSESQDQGLRAEWMLLAGKTDEALQKAKELVDQSEGQVLPLASATWIAWKADKLDQAKIYFEKLRIAAGTANLSTPLLNRLRPLAEQFGFPPEWSIPPTIATDVGPRTPLDLLGPFRWSPYSADDWVLENGDGGVGSMKQFRGKPTILIFYLGFGCLHCVEQLHAFEPRVAQLKQEGFSIAAISTEPLASLQTSLQKLDKPLTIPLFADPQSKAFRAYRCMDDFEQLPLHGTFVISPDGRIVWQDIGHEPFMDVDFVIEEGKRQLRIYSESTR